MMRLVIEHVRDQKPARLAHLCFDGAGIIGELAIERCWIETIGPFDHGRIERGSLVFQVGPIGVKRHRFRDTARGLRRAGEPAHPDAIGPEQMVERGKNRTEKGAVITPPLGIGQRIGDAVQVGILPAVVPRHRLHITDVDHRFVQRTDDG